MNTARTWRTTCTSLGETLALAEAAGRKLQGGEIIELVSDLGGGKTTFVQGLAKGAGSKDRVSSPSFTLANQYQAGGLTIYHFDFYRLHEAGIMRNELAEVLSDPRAVVIVEWAQLVEAVLPTDHLTITIKTTGETSREIALTYSSNLEYPIPYST